MSLAASWITLSNGCHRRASRSTRSYADVSHRGRQAVARCLLDGAPLRSTIAAALSMSDHTFQRRLTSEGTSFTKLVDETRRELVQQHLADRRLSSSEIAYLLGYAARSM